MKRYIFIIVLLFTSLSLRAQDVILKKDGSTVLAKVVSVRADDVEYYIWTSQTGPLYVIKKEDIQQINYQNGQKDVFSAQGSASTFVMPERLQGRPLLGSSYCRVYLQGQNAHGSVLDYNQMVSIMGVDRADMVKNQQTVGMVGGFAAYGLGTVFVGGGLLMLGLSFNDDYVESKKTLRTLGLLSLVLAAIDIPISWKLYSAAPDKIDSIVNDYNSEVRREQMTGSVSRTTSLSLENTHNGIGLVYRF